MALIRTWSLVLAAALMLSAAAVLTERVRIQSLITLAPVHEAALLATRRGATEIAAEGSTTIFKVSQIARMAVMGIRRPAPIITECSFLPRICSVY